MINEICRSLSGHMYDNQYYQGKSTFETFMKDK
jgi:hypothetical protein